MLSRHTDGSRANVPETDVNSCVHNLRASNPHSTRSRQDSAIDRIAIEETFFELIRNMSLRGGADPVDAATKRSERCDLVVCGVERLEDQPPVFGRVQPDRRVRCEIVDQFTRGTRGFFVPARAA